MAKQISSVTFSNAEIDVAEDEIIEVKKDEIVTHSLSAFLNDWNGKPGITISVKQELGYTARPAEEQSF